MFMRLLCFFGVLFLAQTGLADTGERAPSNLDLAQKIARLEGELESDRQRTAEILVKILGRMSDLQATCQGEPPSSENSRPAAASSSVPSAPPIDANTHFETMEVVPSQDEKVIRVTPGEPVVIKFPADVAGGVKRKVSAISLQHQDNTLVIFGSEALSELGEVIIVRLVDKRLYALRIMRSDQDNPRVPFVEVKSPAH